MPQLLPFRAFPLSSRNHKSSDVHKNPKAKDELTLQSYKTQSLERSLIAIGAVRQLKLLNRSWVEPLGISHIPAPRNMDAIDNLSEFHSSDRSRDCQPCCCDSDKQRKFPRTLLCWCQDAPQCVSYKHLSSSMSSCKQL